MGKMSAVIPWGCWCLYSSAECLNKLTRNAVQSKIVMSRFLWQSGHGFCQSGNTGYIYSAWEEALPLFFFSATQSKMEKSEVQYSKSGVHSFAKKLAKNLLISCNVWNATPHLSGKRGRHQRDQCSYSIMRQPSINFVMNDQQNVAIFNLHSTSTVTFCFCEVRPVAGAVCMCTSDIRCILNNYIIRMFHMTACDSSWGVFLPLLTHHNAALYKPSQFCYIWLCNMHLFLILIVNVNVKLVNVQCS